MTQQEKEQIIKFMESEGFEFEKDKHELWTEEFSDLSEHKWKDIFALLNRHHNWQSQQEAPDLEALYVEFERFCYGNVYQIDEIEEKEIFDFFAPHIGQRVYIDRFNELPQNAAELKAWFFKENQIIPVETLELWWKRFEPMLGMVERMGTEWISVKDQLPKMETRIPFIADSTHEEYNDKEFIGVYIGFKFGQHYFSITGIDLPGKYWRQPLPKAPGKE